MVYLNLMREKNQSKFVSYNGIIQSKDKLFLIKYTPQITLWALFYLVQVDLESKSESNLDTKEQGMYYYIFLDKHPDNQGQLMNSVDGGRNGTHT